MFLRRFGTTRIFRPRAHVASSLHEEAKRRLLAKFKPGLYEGADTANAVIQEAFGFYERQLRLIAKSIASRDAADFLLHQYDLATDIIHGEGILDLEERREWLQIEPLFKRGIKYILELFCIAQNPESPRVPKSEAIVAAEVAVECAENSVHLAELSSRVHYLFSNSCAVVVHDRDNPRPLTVKFTGKHADHDLRFGTRMARDRNNRANFIPLKGQFDLHTDKHAEFLDPAFSDSFGMTYAEFIAGLYATIDGALPVGPNYFPTLFIRRKDLFNRLAESGRPKKALDAMLRGFTVTNQALSEENRVVWNVKQKSRAYRRGFFSFPHSSGEHLAFSRSMAREALIQLVSSVPFQKLPEEWLTPKIKKALADLSHAGSKWFEQTVIDSLLKAGYAGGRAKGKVRTTRGELAIPDDVGEIDFLGFCPSQHEILLVESKMTHSGLEAQYWRDDLDQFVTGKRNYAAQFRRKRVWVTENLPQLCLLFGAPSDSILRSHIITLYPNIAAEFLEDITCVSLTEFMLHSERRSLSDT
jgi:hypothetical protein